jgi:hypothetical protein
MTAYDILALPLSIEDKSRLLSQGAPYANAALEKLSNELSEIKKNIYLHFTTKIKEEWEAQYELIWDSYYKAIDVANEELIENRHLHSNFLAEDKFTATSIKLLKTAEEKLILLDQETNFKLWKTLLTLLEPNGQQTT